MKISKHVIVDITMTGDEHDTLVVMLKRLRDLLGPPDSMAEQQELEQVEVMLDRWESR